MPPTFIAAPRCTYCDKSVYFAEEARGPGGKIYHKPCLKCSECSKTLDALHLLDHDGEPFCKPCHSRLFGARGYGAGGALVGDYVQHSSRTNSPVQSPAAQSRYNSPKVFTPKSLPEVTTSKLPLSPVTSPLQSSNSPGDMKRREDNSNLCRRCGTMVYFAEQVLAAGQKWHKRCLRCAGCSTALSSHLTEKDGLPYCKNCYSNKFGHLSMGVMSRPSLY